jgi:hypothetical protein
MMVLRIAIGFVLALAATSGCVPSHVIGPLQHERDEREKLLTRSRRVGASEEILNAVDPPLTSEEGQSIQGENGSCRSSYLWKKGLTWTGGTFVAAAAGLTIGAAYTVGNNDTAPKVLGVSAGSLAALGSILVVIGEIVHQGFTDRGCWVR